MTSTRFPRGRWAEGGSQGTDQGTVEETGPRESLYMSQHVHLCLCMPGEGTCAHLGEEGKASLGASMGESKRGHR